MAKIKGQNDKESIKNEFKRRLYAFVLRLIEFIDKLPDDNVSRRVGDQLLRSGTSIIGNHTEGQSAGSRKHSANYMTHSLKSANESNLWLALLRDTGRANREHVNWFLDELGAFANIFASSILTLKGRK